LSYIVNIIILYEYLLNIGKESICWNENKEHVVFINDIDCFWKEANLIVINIHKNSNINI
jgi:hypothetical protein